MTDDGSVSQIDGGELSGSARSPEEVRSMKNHHRLPVDRVNLFTALGIEIVDQSPERVVAKMPFSEQVSQLTGQFHGGAIVALASEKST